jgi:hypothetical protein
MNIYSTNIDDIFPGLRKMKTEIPPKEELYEIPQTNPFWNKKHTKHTKNLMSKASKGKPKSQEHAINNGKAHEKNWIITNTIGEIFKIRNLSKFCKENNLNLGTMSSVANGRHNAHKGYKVSYGEK